MNMNGSDIKKAAINKAKAVANAANNATNGNGGKKRRKGQDLKPIITTEGPQSADASPSSSVKMNNSIRLVHFSSPPPPGRPEWKLRLFQAPIAPIPPSHTRRHN